MNELHKILNDLMMNIGRSVKLNKKYFLAVLMSIGVQVIFGLNSASATSKCFDLHQKYCNESLKGSKNEYLSGFWNCEIKDPQKYFDYHYAAFENDLENARLNNNSREKLISWAIESNAEFKELVDRGIANRDKDEINYRKLQLCISEERLSWLQQGSKPKSNSSSSQASSSGSSNQSNKKANQQSANNHSSSSSSSDLSNKSQEQLFEILDSAENRGDYAQAYAAEKQLAKDPSAFIKRQALRRIGYRLAEGRGVKINLNEARKYFEQAAGMGDLDASANLCVFNILGKGAPENHKKAMEYCLFAAEKGHATAQYNLAWLYQSGNSIQRDKALSDMWTCKAAAQGDEMAVINAKKLNLNCN